MRIGIDFGTTRIVVAAADRGNYPLVNFEAPGGRIRDWYPSVLAVRGDQRVYGWEALELEGQAGWTIMRSLKRWLKGAGPQTEITLAGQRLKVSALATEMMAALRTKLVTSSSLAADRPEKLQAMLGVPANANSNQRFLTEEIARAAGFEVLGLSNEPSAAAIEFAYRDTVDRKPGGKSGLLVYDLGGGTFDTSLVALDETEYSIVASDGVSDLGGDDFDEILASLALAAAGITPEEESALTAAERFHLLDECRDQKEALNPNSRKVTVDLQRVRPGWSEVSVPVDIFYERCRPLIERSWSRARRDARRPRRFQFRHPLSHRRRLRVTARGPHSPRDFRAPRPPPPPTCDQPRPSASPFAPPAMRAACSAISFTPELRRLARSRCRPQRRLRCHLSARHQAAQEERKTAAHLSQLPSGA